MALDSTRAPVLLLALVACGGSSTDDGHDASPVDVASVDSAQGSGTCLAPRVITLGFQEPATGSTAQQLDITMPSCVPGSSLPESVYELRLDQATTVHITASDRSGQGVGVQVRADSCTGTSVACDWADNGVIDRSLALPSGTWILIVERSPAGPFGFAVTL